VSVAETGRRSRPGDLRQRQVLLVAESAGLAAVLHHLLDPADRLSRLGSLRELAESRALEAADVVVLDVPPEDRAAIVHQVRQRYLGPLVVLVARGERPARLRLDEASALLARPFSAEELRAALAAPVGPASAPWAPTPVQGPSAPGTPAVGPVDPEAAARRAPPRHRAPATRTGQLHLIDRAQRLPVALTQGWRTRRRMRVAGVSAFALVAFTAAFLAVQGGRCGPGCDALGTGLSPAPTVAPASSLAPSTTGPRRATETTAAPAGSSAPGVFGGVSGGGRLATATSATMAEATTTTARRPATTTPATTTPATTRPATTRPVTTQSTVPPTTAPTTTEPTVPPTTGGA
jgi:hypothetical protein